MGLLTEDARATSSTNSWAHMPGKRGTYQAVAAMAYKEDARITYSTRSSSNGLHTHRGCW